MSKRLEGGYLGARPSWSLAANPGIWAVEQVYARRVAGTWPVGAGSFDEFYEYVTFLLHANGTNASTSFPDSSLYGRAVTVSGNAQVSTAQSKFGGASIYFDGTGDYLVSGTSTPAFNLSNDFTVEFWVYPTLADAVERTYIHVNAGGAGGFHIHQNGQVLKVDNGLAADYASGNVLTLNQWQHIAVTKQGVTLYIFLNGTLLNSRTAQSYTVSDRCQVGRYSTGGTTSDFAGYIDELRITNNYARYTSNFTVPTGPSEDEGATLADPFYNYVSLLLPMNGSNNSTTFTDKSPSPRTVTPSGDAKLSTADKRYGVSSAYFDGTGDYLTIADANSGFSFGTGDFTYEWWFKSSATNNYAAMVTRPYSGAGGILISLNGATGDGAPEVYWREWTNGLFFKSSVTGLNDNKWHHFAFVRTGTTVYMFIDGVQAASKTSVSTSVGSSSVIVGQDIEYAGRTYTGYIDDIRITKGVARYVANFIPPLPHADYGTLVDPYLGSTSLLMPMEGPNNSTGFFDRADRLPVTTYGNAKISNAQYKWGLTSAYFDGTGDYLQVGSQPTFGTSDFTIEFWVYPITLAGTQVYAEFRPSEGAYPLIYNNGGSIYYYVSSANRITGSNALTINTWHHIAVTRSGTSTRLFCNGSQVGTTYTDSTSYLAPNVKIGNSFDSFGANAYIDDFRVTNGIARYTTNFTPPTAAFNSDSTSDPYLSNVSLLLKMDGANNSTTFTDSSLTPKAVFANGDAKISTTQSKFGGTSAYLDGNGDHLSIPNSNDFEFGSGDFTIEFWAYVTALKGYQAFIAKSYAAADQNGWGLICESSNVITFYAGNGSWTLSLSAGVTPTINTWQHYALTRSGTTWRLFIDGQVKASTTNSLSPTAGTLPLYIGRYPYFPGFNSAQDLSGYIDDFRITKGVARYTANFLPPTISHPVWSQTDASFSSVSLLLNGNGANASTVIADRSTNGLTVVPNGDAKISTTQSRFGGSSLYFDGTGDYLSIAYTSVLEPGTGDFTIEFWANLADLTYRFFLGGPLNSGGYLFMAINPTASGQIWVGRSGTDWPLQFSSHSIQANTWAHIAVSRSGTSNRCFVNGVQIGSTITDSTNWLINPSGFWIGGQTGGSSLNGYIDDLRITKGVARYTAAFTPPVAPYPIPVIDANFGAVSLLLHMNGANASTYFPDHSYNALTVTANGNAQISTAQSKFGGASAYFDGTGDWLSTASSTVFGFGLSDFTMETWLYISGGQGTDRNIFDYRASGGNDIGTFFIDGPTNKFAFWYGTKLGASGTALTTNTWYHVAFVRSNGVFTCYLNGVVDFTATASVDFGTSRALAVGATIASGIVGNGPFTGYIDSLRITKGIARYTAAFTPPTAQFPNS